MTGISTPHTCTFSVRQPWGRLYVLALLVRSPFGGAKGDATTEAILEHGDTHAVGIKMFSEYLLQFEIVGVFLLGAVIGAIVLAKTPKSANRERKAKVRREGTSGREKIMSRHASRVTMIPLSAYVAVSAVLFITGLLGVLIRRNFIIVLMSVEIMLNAANINLIAFSHYLESMAGQLVALFIIAIAAGEAAIGLAIIIVVFRGKISTNVDEMNLLKW